MRAKYVTGITVTDLGTDAPFLPNYTIVVVNANTSAQTLQFGDASTGPFHTAHQPDGTTAVVPAGAAIEVVVSGRYAAIEGGAGQLILLGN
jgi:hypothetical protein